MFDIIKQQLERGKINLLLNGFIGDFIVSCKPTESSQANARSSTHRSSFGVNPFVPLCVEQISMSILKSRFIFSISPPRYPRSTSPFQTEGHASEICSQTGDASRGSCIPALLTKRSRTASNMERKEYLRCMQSFSKVSYHFPFTAVNLYNLICGAVYFHIQEVGHIIIVRVRFELYLE